MGDLLGLFRQAQHDVVLAGDSQRLWREPGGRDQGGGGAPQPSGIIHRQQEFGGEIRLEEGVHALLRRIETQFVGIEQICCRIGSQCQGEGE
jgi:hypothetical protein